MNHEYEYIYEIYKAKSFTKAAQNLFISQPALSSYVKKVEEQYGFKIFNRKSSELQLTEQGKVYVEAAKKIYEIESDLETYAKDLSDPDCGTLSLAGSSLYSASVIPRIAKTLHALYPRIEMRFFEADSLQLYKEALEDHVDLIVDSGSCSELFNRERLFDEEILLAVPSDLPEINNRHLARLALSDKDIAAERYLDKDCPSVKLSVFRNAPFILLKEGHDMHKRASALFAEAGIEMSGSIIYLNQLMTAYHMASVGLGITFATDSIIHTMGPTKKLCYFKIDTKEPSLLRREVFIAYRKDAHLTHVMQHFINTGKQMSMV